MERPVEFCSSDVVLDNSEEGDELFYRNFSNDDFDSHSKSDIFLLFWTTFLTQAPEVGIYKRKQDLDQESDLEK